MMFHSILAMLRRIRQRLAIARENRRERRERHNANSRLLQLPAELQNMIMQRVLGVEIIALLKFYMYSGKNRKPQRLAVLHTCRVLRNRYLHMFYSRINLRLRMYLKDEMEWARQWLRAPQEMYVFTGSI